MRTHTKGSSSGRQAPLKDSKVHGPTQKTLKTAQLKPLASLPQHLWRRRSVSGPLSSSVEKSAFVDGLQAKIEAQLAAFQKQLRENMHAELQAFRNARSTPAYTKLISLPVDIVEIKSESENEDDQCPVQSRALSNADLKSEDDGPDASGLGIYDATPGPARMAEANSRGSFPDTQPSPQPEFSSRSAFQESPALAVPQQKSITSYCGMPMPVFIGNLAHLGEITFPKISTKSFRSPT
ncbi:uncharacterized protein L3040_001770 [Drepanopeziza brunnea f. sp. 'multigermtubi']|uniref:uncharacterized protein n=1 Tax=Drepanopeziza brunnea f. sp. 'multigermtubi' TaxID=698441 RepID=UPI0023A409ED|nr:hypothetical protein L3040_001770 [Drepanopeziza brunnea f. sp. 'multigermtubi']